MQGFIQDCRRIEELARSIYQHFAATDAYCAEVRQLFRQLSDDERDHALELDLLLPTIGPPIDAAPVMSWDKLQETLHLAEELFATATRQKLDEEGALRMAVQLEQNFIKIHAHNVLAFGSTQLAQLFEDLGKADRLHLDRLRNCLQWWHSQDRTAPAGR